MKRKIYYLEIRYEHRTTPEFVWSDNEHYIRNYCERILSNGRGRNKIIRGIKEGTAFMKDTDQVFDGTNELCLFRTHDNKDAVVMTYKEYMLLQIMTTDCDNGLFCIIDETIDTLTKSIDFIKNEEIRNQLDHLPVVVDSGNFDFVKWYKTTACTSPRFWRFQ